jgi:hypothetical protein
MMRSKYRSKDERHVFHESHVEERLAVFEVSDSDNFEDRQKARNIFRYQARGYCFELPPKCSRYGRYCAFCHHLKCRENDQYDGEKWDYNFDPDVDRYLDFCDCLKSVAISCNTDDDLIRCQLPKIDNDISMYSLLTLLADTQYYE